MNDHRDAVDRVVRHFVQEYAAGDPAARYRVVRSGVADNLHVVVSISRFTDMREWDRQDLVENYLEEHLPDADRVFVSKIMTLAPDEWDTVDLRPTPAALAA